MYRETKNKKEAFFTYRKSTNIVVYTKLEVKKKTSE